MGKNVTIYLPDDVAEKMEKFPEVNWSEICRKAITDYIETRSQVDLGPIIERLKKERNLDYQKGQIFMYNEVIPKLSWGDVEVLRQRVDQKLLQQKPPLLGEEPIGQLAAEQSAIRNMHHYLTWFAEENQIKLPECTSLSFDSFYEGAVDALMDIYKRAKGKKK